MSERCDVNWIASDHGADALAGSVRWDPVHSVWNGGMLAIALIAGPATFSIPAFATFIVLTGLAVLLGHSIGFHRLLIHRSFSTSFLVERFLVWCGTIAGMSGPLWIVRTHDQRDWAQRQEHCHSYLRHGETMLKDAWWQLHCRLELENLPRFDLSAIKRHRFYRFLERSWMAQQLPLAFILFAIGGWAFIVWGICARVAITVHGHWFVGYLAHNRGPQSWLVTDAGVQAFDVPWAAIPTMGEAWHNNHHAYPGSARIGLYAGQSDWGYAVIRGLERIGLAWNVCLPEAMPERARHLTNVQHTNWRNEGTPRSGLRQ